MSIETLVEDSCGECGIRFAWPNEFYQRKLTDGSSWFCPNGHRRYFCQSKTSKLNEQISILKEELKYERGEKEIQRRKVASEKGKRTRLLRKIENGLCPHCNCKFSNVKRHITCKHKDM